MASDFRGRIGRRLVLGFVSLVLLVVGTCGWVLYDLTQKQLDRQMSDHLMRAAQLIAQGIDGDVVIALRPEYGLHQRLLGQLLTMRDLAEARRIYVFDREGRSLMDTHAGVAFGQPYPGLSFDRSELARVWTNRPAHSVRFRDASGVEYKTGYAPIVSGNQVVAAVGVEIGVGFLEAIETFQHSVVLLGIVAVVLTVAVGLVLGRTLTQPISRLVAAARTMGEGRLAEPVVVPSRDELGYLADTMDEMRQQLLARDERLRQMLAGVAHEIRNPLGGIELYAGLIAADLDKADGRRAHILRVIDEVRRLNEIISDFLTYARPANSQPEWTPMAPLIDEARFLLAPEMDAANVAFDAGVPSDLSFCVDPGQIKQVFVNLMRNAIQAMPDGGRLRVEAEARADGRFVRVIDTGCGVDPDHLSHLFEPFFTTREQGSGLGLAIVKQLVVENGGQISVNSSSGCGATFEVVFPAVPG